MMFEYPQYAGCGYFSIEGKVIAHQPMEQYEIQQDWDWEIAVYLFLGGVSGGAYVGGVAFGTALNEPLILSFGIVIALLSIVVGSLLLIYDLGVPKRAYLVFLRPDRSWMARGSWIIAIFSLLATIHLVLTLGWIALGPTANLVLGAMTSIFALSLMAYTGILLQQCRSIPLWRSWLLPALFFISAASTGVMSLILSTVIYAHAAGQSQAMLYTSILSQADIFLLVVELGIVAGLLYSVANHSTAGAESVTLLSRGTLSREFWVAFLLLGIFIPLTVEIVEVTYELSSFVLALGMVAGLVGGFYLRWLVLRAAVNELLHLKDHHVPYAERWAE